MSLHHTLSNIRRGIAWLAAALVTCFAGLIIFDLARLGWPALALLANALLLPMWIVAVFYLTKPDLSYPPLEPYFAPRRWERDGAIYLRCGVLHIQALIFALGRRRPRGFRIRREESFLTQMEHETRAAEAAHVVCLIAVMMLAVYAVAMGSVSGAVWLVGTGLVFQGYAVVLQRYHRPRWRHALRLLHHARTARHFRTTHDNNAGNGLASATP